MNTQSNFQYGTSMLPVLLKSVLDKKTGTGTLRKFLQIAWKEIEAHTEASKHRHRSVIRLTHNRLEHLEVNRYFDLTQRKQRALTEALKSVENYLQDEREEWLEKALCQYETGERYFSAGVRMRMKLAPMVCERISRAS